MKHLIREHKQFFILLVVFFLAEILVAPLGEFPLNDDWSYAKAVRIFNAKSEFNFGMWPAMTLCSHILWGSLFTKLFGFSHVVLRFSTVVSAIIALIFLYKLLLRINGNKKVAVWVCAVLLFNPIFFNLVNTYMTDVNFCTLTILSCYYIYRFHETGRLIYFLPVFIFSTLLILVRQFGIIVPVCFIISCGFVREKKWRALLMAFLVFAAALAVFKIYEDYLQRILPKTSTYKFSQNFDLLSAAFWENFFKGVTEKWSSVLLHILIYLFPFALIALVHLYKKSGLLKSILISALSIVACYFMFRNECFPFQNIFTNMKVGPETLYQSFQANHHAKSDQFQNWMNVLKIAGTAVTMTVILLLVTLRPLKSYRIRNIVPFHVFLFFALLSYVFLVFITESYFDRYNLPLIVMGLILMAGFFKEVSASYSLASVLVALMFYVSVAGTKDYFTWNEKRWEAYYFLRKEHKVPEVFINAGFEVSCWTDRDYEMSFHFGRIDIIRFLVQFDPEEGFVPLKEYEFQRYFPYKKDKINIFVRQVKK